MPSPNPNSEHTSNTTSTRQVDTAVKLIRDSDSIYSHTGHFTVLNLDEVGLKRKVTASLSLDGATKDELYLYERSRRRKQMWKRKNEVWRTQLQGQGATRFVYDHLESGTSYHR